MKKVLSFVLVLSMILGSFGMAFAAPAADVVGKDYEDAVNVLTELGVVAGYKDGTYRPENVVTRAEMATFIIKAMGLADYAVEKSAFTDMAGHWADPFVAYAASLGFVAGNTDGTFNPDAPVTYDQAITMLVQALGYQGKYLTGGYPGAFVNQAKTLGMLDGVKSGVAGANRGDVATLLFNTLTVPFVRYDADGKLDYVALSADRKDTMMERLGAGMYNGGVPFVAGTAGHTTAAKEYYGAFVTAYADADGDILAIEEVKSVFLTGKMDDGKFVADGVEYEVNEGYKTTSGATTVSSAAFENGTVSGSALLASQTGTVTIGAKVSGKIIKEVYSVAKWTNAVGQRVEAADLENVAEDCKLLTKDFAKNDDLVIDTDSFELVGVEALEDIEEDNIVYVYVNKNNKIAKVEVGTEVIENAKITKKNATDLEVTVNGKAYAFSGVTGAESAYGDANIKVGDSYDFYLDAAGDIWFADPVVTSAADYAIVAETADGVDSLNGVDGKIKLILEDGSAKVFTVNKDAAEDGDIEYAAGATISGIASVSSISTGSVVKFALNEDGELNKVECVATAGAAGDISAKGTFASHKLAADVVILTNDASGFTSVTALSVDDKNYTAVTRESVLGKEDVEAHIVTKDGEIVFMVMAASGVSDDVIYGFVNKIEEIDDPATETVWEVTIMANAKETVYKTKNATVSSATTAAVTGYALNADGYLGFAKAADNKAVTLTNTSTAAISRVTDKVYVDVAGENVYYMTLDADVEVYEAEDGKMVTATKGDLRGVTASAITFIDVTGDGVADIVVK